MDSFSEQLRAEAEPIWRRIFAHPFLQEIKAGTLPLETFQYYLGQDYLYLEGFARCVAIALAKSPNAGVLEEMAKRVMTPIERPLHHKLLEAAGLTLDDAKGTVPSPTNAGYVNHMLAVANREGLGPTAAALLPCPWTYHLLREEVGQSEHPIYGQWSNFYVSGLLEDSVAAWRSFVDRQAEQAGPEELEAMRQAFMTSSRYEYMFWEAAHRREGWPV